MRSRLAVLVAVTSLLTVLSVRIAGASSAAVDRAYVDSMLHGVSMGQFLDAVGDDPWFDWSTDLCSAPLVGSTGVSFDFRHPCRRHDFGYRNLKLIDRRYGTDQWNSTSRRTTDDRFLVDMRAHCRTRSLFLQPSCLSWAQVFYTAVRVAGGGA